ncbi:transglutaminase [Zhengella mangrovi]|uniref:Transglutaminase n=1 Tax=Zhengella mangrovi TaxID=1982044 RepID=A0A2G1QK77_9HYPH|nr:transglutaminase family protein [Zhengella mangrovi]PHP65937.1 transglutaminase [Zhengella mangrovi]
MLYDIRLSIEYDYETPAEAGLHVLRMVPRALAPLQKVIESRLDFDPLPAGRSERFDFFGNPVTTIRYGEAVTRTAFLMTALVDRQPGRVPDDTSPPLEDLKAGIRAIASLGPQAPHHFLPPSPRVSPDPIVTAWAAGIAVGAASVFAIVSKLCAALHEEMVFDPTSTAVDTPFSEAFAARHGVCQDFSHVMIAALRSLGIPAGYVSGFLRTIPPEGQPRLEGADAMHAWVTAWCGPGMGWIEFDPTNNLIAGEDHVVVALGRDYFDVAPVKGNLRMSGGQTSLQSVDMIVRQPG